MPNDLEQSIKLVLDQKSARRLEQDAGKSLGSLADKIQADFAKVGKVITDGMARSWAKAAAESTKLTTQMEKQARLLSNKATGGHNVLSGAMSAALGGQVDPAKALKSVEDSVRRLRAQPSDGGGLLSRVLFGRSTTHGTTGQRFVQGGVGLAQQAAQMPLGMSGLGGVTSGLGMLPGMGMLAGGTLALGAGALAFGGASLSRAMDANRARRRAAQAGVSIGRAQRIDSQGFMGTEEMLGLGTELSRATGSASSSALRNLGQLQTSFGLGSAGAGLMGSVARGGGSTNATNQAKLFGSVIGAALAQHLEKGRFGEVMTGVAQVIEGGAVGKTLNAHAVAGLSAALGQDSSFRGVEGFKVMQGLNNLAQGNSGTPGGRAIGLMMGGLGQGGTSYVQALKNMEGGLFEGGDKGGVDKTKKMLGMFRQMYGGGELGQLALSRSAGISATAAGKLFDLDSSGKLDAKSLKSIQESGMSTQEKAASAMLKAFDGPDAALNKIQDSLEKIGLELMPLMVKALQAIEKGVDSLVGFFIGSVNEAASSADAAREEALKYGESTGGTPRHMSVPPIELSVHVPENAKAGVYRAKASASHGNAAAARAQRPGAVPPTNRRGMGGT